MDKGQRQNERKYKFNKHKVDKDKVSKDKVTQHKTKQNNNYNFTKGLFPCAVSIIKLLSASFRKMQYMPTSGKIARA